jgi:CRP-like cAMP-binding protein
MFGVVGAVVLGEGFLTTSAIGAVIVGFALQDTLGNAFAGLAIQIEKPFRVGHWIRVGQFEGQVVEITWRATKIRTKAGNLVVVPNNIVSKEAIANYSEPIAPTRLSVSVGVSYDTPPNEVKDALLEGMARSPLILRSPEPDVLLVDFGNSAIVYQARFWIADFKDDDVAMDQARSGIYYVLKRRRIEIPYPIQTEISVEPPPPGRTADKKAELMAHVSAVDVFSGLDDHERAALVDVATEQLYAAGETVVRQGDAGNSMFIVCSGTLRVTFEPGNQEMAELGPGEYFGEMSLLTGDARTATVVATTDSLLLQLTADAFRRVVLSNPTVVERISVEVLTRRQELDAARRAAPSQAIAVEGAGGFLAMVRRFLQLPDW